MKCLVMAKKKLQRNLKLLNNFNLDILKIFLDLLEIKFFV